MVPWLPSFGNSIAWLANILQVATVVFAAYAAFRLWKQNRQLRDLARKVPPVENFQKLVSLYEGVQTTKPLALAVSLVDTTHSIKPQVEQFLEAKGWSMTIEELNMDGIKGKDDLEKLINALREKRRYLESTQCTELHLFIQGPVQAGTIIGSLYRQWIPVKLYHRPTPQTPQVYEYWMPLL